MQKRRDLDLLLGCMTPRGQDPDGLEEWVGDPQVLQRWRGSGHSPLRCPMLQQKLQNGTISVSLAGDQVLSGRRKMVLEPVWMRIVLSEVYACASLSE